MCANVATLLIAFSPSLSLSLAAAPFLLLVVPKCWDPSSLILDPKLSHHLHMSTMVQVGPFQAGLLMSTAAEALGVFMGPLVLNTHAALLSFISLLNASPLLMKSPLLLTTRPRAPLLVITTPLVVTLFPSLISLRVFLASIFTTTFASEFNPLLSSPMRSAVLLAHYSATQNTTSVLRKKVFFGLLMLNIGTINVPTCKWILITCTRMWPNLLVKLLYLLMTDPSGMFRLVLLLSMAVLYSLALLIMSNFGFLLTSSR